MKTEKNSQGMRGGFTRTTVERAALIRKGNEVFNQGDYQTAKRIFATVGYTDGLSRLGDHYYKNGDAPEALKMYALAKDTRKVALLAERIAVILRGWLKEDDKRV